MIAHNNGERGSNLVKAGVLGFAFGATSGLLFSSVATTMIVGSVSAMGSNILTRTWVGEKEVSQIDLLSVVCSGVFGALATKFPKIFPKDDFAGREALEAVLSGVGDFALEWAYHGATTIPDFWERLIDGDSHWWR